jgi:hypothetical protein
MPPCGHPQVTSQGEPVATCVSPVMGGRGGGDTRWPAHPVGDRYDPCNWRFRSTTVAGSRGWPGWADFAGKYKNTALGTAFAHQTQRFVYRVLRTITEQPNAV